MVPTISRILIIFWKCLIENLKFKNNTKTSKMEMEKLSPCEWNEAFCVSTTLINMRTWLNSNEATDPPGRQNNKHTLLFNSFILIALNFCLCRKTYPRLIVREIERECDSKKTNRNCFCALLIFSCVNNSCVRAYLSLYMPFQCCHSTNT